MTVRIAMRNRILSGSLVALAAVVLPACAQTEPPPLTQAPAPALSAAPAAADGQLEIPSDAKGVRPLAPGDRVPPFVVRRPDGSNYAFEPSTRTGSAVVIFYRGGWCPYCNVHLGQLKAAQASLRERGYEVLFMSSDRPEILFSSLKDDVEKEASSYTLLSDSDAAAAKAFRVAFRMSEQQIEQYKGYGIDLEATQGNTQHILPVPAVFVVDATGTVKFASFNPDYQVRLSAAELLAAAP